MEKFAAPIVALVSVFLYFTHDAGFNFEDASAEKRVAFAERQAQKAVSQAHLLALGVTDTVFVSGGQKMVRVQLHSDGPTRFSPHRPEFAHHACEGYFASYLDEHSISLHLEFYNGPSEMAGSMVLSKSTCASFGVRNI